MLEVAFLTAGLSGEQPRLRFLLSVASVAGPRLLVRRNGQYIYLGTLEDPTARSVPLHSLLLFHPIFRPRRQLLLGPPLQLLFPIRPFLLPLQVLCLLGHLVLLLLGLALLLLRPDLGITGSVSSTHSHFCSLPGFHWLHLLRQRLHGILSCLPHRNNLGTCMGSAYSSPASTPCPAWPSGPTCPLPFHQLMDALPALHRRTQQHSTSLIRMY